MKIKRHLSESWIRIIKLENLSMGQEMTKELHEVNEEPFVEIQEDGFSFEVKKGSCGVGNHIVIELQYKVGGHKGEIDATGKVKELNPTEEGSVLVSVRTSQKGSSDWEWVAKEFANQQEKVSDLFDQLKGIK